MDIDFYIKLLKDTNPRDWHKIKLTTMNTVAKHFKLPLSEIRERDRLEKELQRILWHTDQPVMDQTTLRRLANAFVHLNGHSRVITESTIISEQDILELSKPSSNVSAVTGSSSLSGKEVEREDITSTTGGRKRKSAIGSTDRVLRPRL